MSGRVLVRAPGGRVVALDDGAVIPSGSIVNATNGRLWLKTALPGGRVQTGQFWGGRFEVRQRRDGMTDLYLRDKPPVCTRGRRSLATSSKRRRRGLWGRDRRGKFRTHGRNSVATVRGTAWRTEETCRGTVTTVTEGAVSVRDRRARRTVLVRAGRSYVARSRR
jgi:hypothetical protein